MASTRHWKCALLAAVIAASLAPGTARGQDATIGPVPPEAASSLAGRLWGSVGNPAPIVEGYVFVVEPGTDRVLGWTRTIRCNCPDAGRWTIGDLPGSGKVRLVGFHPAVHALIASQEVELLGQHLDVGYLRATLMPHQVDPGGPGGAMGGGWLALLRAFQLAGWIASEYQETHADEAAQALAERLLAATATIDPASSPELAASVRQGPQKTLGGNVVASLRSPPYSLLRIEGASGLAWAAVPLTQARVGDPVCVLNPIPIRAYRSEPLRRTFEVMNFGSPGTLAQCGLSADAQGTRGGAQPTTAGQGAPSPSTAAGTSGGAVKGLFPARSAYVLGLPPDAPGAPGFGDKTIAWLGELVAGEARDAALKGLLGALGSRTLGKVIGGYLTEIVDQAREVGNPASGRLLLVPDLPARRQGLFTVRTATQGESVFPAILVGEVGDELPLQRDVALQLDYLGPTATSLGGMAVQTSSRIALLARGEVPSAVQPARAMIYAKHPLDFAAGPGFYRLTHPATAGYRISGVQAIYLEVRVGSEEVAQPATGQGVRVPQELLRLTSAAKFAAKVTFPRSTTWDIAAIRRHPAYSGGAVDGQYLVLTGHQFKEFQPAEYTSSGVVFRPLAIPEGIELQYAIGSDSSIWVFTDAPLPNAFMPLYGFMSTVSGPSAYMSYPSAFELTAEERQRVWDAGIRLGVEWSDKYLTLAQIGMVLYRDLRNVGLVSGALTDGEIFIKTSVSVLNATGRTVAILTAKNLSDCLAGGDAIATLDVSAWWPPWPTRCGPGEWGFDMAVVNPGTAWYAFNYLSGDNGTRKTIMWDGAVRLEQYHYGWAMDCTVSPVAFPKRVDLRIFERVWSSNSAIFSLVTHADRIEVRNVTESPATPPTPKPVVRYLARGWN